METFKEKDSGLFYSLLQPLTELVYTEYGYGTIVKLPPSLSTIH